MLARAEWTDPAIFEALLTDSAGHIVSGTMSNVFIVREQTLLTPPVDQCGVAGVIRSVVLREAAASGLRPQVTALAPRDLQTAEEAFLTNSRIGLLPISQLGARALPVGHQTLALAARVEQLDA